MLIDWFTVAAQGINFLILVWLFKAYLFKPALAVIDERQRLIVSELEAAAESKKEADAEKASLEVERSALDSQKSVALEAARTEAGEERQRLFSAAEKDASETRQKLLDSVDQEVKRRVGDISSRLMSEVVSISRKALAELADASLEDKIVDTLIRRLHEEDADKRATLEQSIQSGSAAISVRSSTELSEAAKGNIVREFGADPVVYQVDPSMGAGVEISVADLRVVWNLDSYMDSLQGEIEAASVPSGGKA